MSHPFSDDDKAFLRGILSNPAELSAWLVYADWLDERDDPRGPFVRLQARRSDPSLSDTERRQVEATVKAIRGTYDPDWVAVFDRPRVENCDARFAFVCPKKWENLTATDDTDVRYCSGCRKTVHYCHDIGTARGLATRGACVAVATGVPRHPGDLHEYEELVTMGIMPPDESFPESPPEPPPPRKRRRRRE